MATGRGEFPPPLPIRRLRALRLRTVEVWHIATMMASNDDVPRHDEGYRMRLRRVVPVVAGIGLLLLLLACELPGPPRATQVSPLLSPVTTEEQPTTQEPKGESSGFTVPISWPAFAQNTPLLLAAVGAVLFLITAFVVYFLLRGWPRRRGRPARMKHELAPAISLPNSDELTAGTLLDQGRYLVLGKRSVSELGAVYEVKSTTPLTLCSHCYAPSLGSGKLYCSRCGERLGEVGGEHPVLLAREMRDPQRFEAVAELLEGAWAHRSVIAPLARFEETSFGPVRHFQIEPDVRGPRGSGVGVHRPLAQVLGWGVSLSRGMAFLHAHGLALDGVHGEGIVIDGDEARWLGVEGLRLLGNETEESRVQLTATNVRDLARFLLRVATGRDDVGASKALPDVVGAVLSQALRSHGPLHAGDFAEALHQAREQLAFREPARYLVGHQTDVGNARKLNEDSWLVLDMTAEPGPHRLSVAAFIVADGVGGHAAGDVASRLTVEAIAGAKAELGQAAHTGTPPNAETWLVQAAQAANEAVRAERIVASNDMGSTLVMALLIGRAATVLNVGDSRAYWLRPEGLRQVTTDHSLVQRLVEVGQITPEEARHHPQKSVIYRVIGDSAELAVDLFDVALAPGEALLLCSDGLSDMVMDDVIWRVWRESVSPQAACDHLVMLAKEAGGYDNITVVIVQLASVTT